MAFQDHLFGAWNEQIKEELSQIEDFNEIFQNTNEDNFNFSCEELGLSYLFSLLNSQNTATLRNTMIAQVQGTGISTEQQKKNWLINWYFENDPTSSIYLATLRNPALVASYQTSPGMLYGTPFAIGMENYFQKIKNHFGQTMFDHLLTEFAQQSNLYVDEIKVDEWHIYGSSRLGVYEANRTISKRVARDLNNDNQMTNNEYVIETPEEVMYLYSSYQLERGAKRYELANHLGNVLTVISDKKTANFTGTTFTYFTAERISATDYSPFGAPLAGRTWNGGEYRFGFNSMEKDNEINGTGNAYDFGARIYDGRLGRWMALDPLMIKYSYLSPYNFVANSPIIYIDPDGKKIVISGSQEFVSKSFAQLQQITSVQLVILSNGVVMEANKLNEWESQMVVQKGMVVKPDNYVEKVKKPFGTELVSKAIESTKVITIESTDNGYHDENETKFDDPTNSIVPGVGSSSTIYHDPTDDGTKSEPHIKNQDGTEGRSPVIALGHELIHALKGALGTRLTGKSNYGDPDNLKKNGKTFQLSNEEVDTRSKENIISEEQGEPIRAKPLPGIND